MQGVQEKDYVIGKQVESCIPCSLASKKWGALEAPWQMTPTGAAVVWSNACDIVAEDALSLASQHSIGLIDIKLGISWAHREDLSLDMSEKSELIPVRNLRLLE